MKLLLQDTLLGKKTNFQSLKDNEVSLYVCGVTLYDDIHIGHLKSILSFEVMRNYFIEHKNKVILVRNITDVDDKIIAKAESLGVDPLFLVNSYINNFHEIMKELDLPSPDVEPRVTEFLKEISDYIQELIDKGFAYKTNDGVYFDTQKNKLNKYPLSKKIVDDLDDNSRLDIMNYQKKHKADFALWKEDKKYGYESQVFEKQGRPGWHIECSVMHHHTLGKQFDIHGGGRDLIFPHHENEILQSVAHNNIMPARYWIHNGMMTKDGKKLSKSLGNSIYVKDILKKYSAESLKLFLNKGQYNQSQEFSEDELKDAQNFWNDFVRNIPQYVVDIKSDYNYFNNVLEVLSDDFNTPKALTFLYEAVRQLKKTKNDKLAFNILKILKILSIVPQDATLNSIYKKWNLTQQIPTQITDLLNKRQKAKKDKDYVLADKYREEILNLGWSILDTKDGYELRKNQ